MPVSPASVRNNPPAETPSVFGGESVDAYRFAVRCGAVALVLRKAVGRVRVVQACHVRVACHFRHDRRCTDERLGIVAAYDTRLLRVHTRRGERAIEEHPDGSGVARACCERPRHRGGERRGNTPRIYVLC